MPAFSSLRFAKSPFAPHADTTAKEVVAEEFAGRIDRKLSIVFVSLFLLVLLVGGSSLYLLSSHLLKSDVIARQSEQIDIVEQISRRLEAFASMIQLAHLRGQTVPDFQITASLADLDAHLNLYKDKGGAERNIRELRQMVADAEGVAVRMLSNKKLSRAFLLKRISVNSKRWKPSSNALKLSASA
jgi:hypothetical protein